MSAMKFGSAVVVLAAVSAANAASVTWSGGRTGMFTFSGATVVDATGKAKSKDVGAASGSFRIRLFDQVNPSTGSLGNAVDTDVFSFVANSDLGTRNPKITLSQSEGSFGETGQQYDYFYAEASNYFSLDTDNPVFQSFTVSGGGSSVVINASNYALAISSGLVTIFEIPNVVPNPGGNDLLINMYLYAFDFSKLGLLVKSAGEFENVIVTAAGNNTPNTMFAAVAVPIPLPTSVGLGAAALGMLAGRRRR